MYQVQQVYSITAHLRSGYYDNKLARVSGVIQIHSYPRQGTRQQNNTDKAKQ